MADLADAVLTPIARTVPSRVVDEFVLEFTRETELPWMLPGVAPTGRRVRIPTEVVMGFSDDEVAYEHIYWDQAPVLVQIGLLDPALLQGSGAEQADRLQDMSGATPGPDLALQAHRLGSPADLTPDRGNRFLSATPPRAPRPRRGTSTPCPKRTEP